MLDLPIGESAACGRKAGSLRERAYAALASVHDPEIPVLTIADLGILRAVRVDAEGGLQREPVFTAPELSIIVPTFNECENVPVLVDRLRKALPGVAWEMIIVDDDSPDGTADVARTIGATDARIRCLRRVGRRGLSGACLEGMLASQARYAAVMDADLQHDERLLLPMLAKLRSDEADVVIGTRYAQGGGADTAEEENQPPDGVQVGRDQPEHADN